jgi:hypothetical protein
MGARFIHQRSGFTLDLLQIQSVPQAMIWVTTYPTSNMGEPHTQEHLPLAKGQQRRRRRQPGRDVAGEHERLYRAGAHLLRILHRSGVRKTSKDRRRERSRTESLERRGND